MGQQEVAAVRLGGHNVGLQEVAAVRLGGHNVGQQEVAACQDGSWDCTRWVNRKLLPVRMGVVIVQNGSTGSLYWAIQVGTR